MRSTKGTLPFPDPDWPFPDTNWFAINKTIIRYTRKDSVGSIVRTLPNGGRRKPPTIRARCYAQPGDCIASISI